MAITSDLRQLRGILEQAYRAVPSDPAHATNLLDAARALTDILLETSLRADVASVEV